MRHLILLGFCTLALLGIARAASTVVGGWKPIKNVDDPEVQAIAEFAVDAYNQQSQSTLLLGKVLSGDTQVVAGTKYRLRLTAAPPGGKPHFYEAVVVEKAWLNYRSLISFTEIGDA